jgi:hypothetical protein
MNEKCNQIVETLISNIKDKFNVSEEELENLKKEWLDVVIELINDEEHLKCSPCTECGNLLCLGDLCR